MTVRAILLGSIGVLAETSDIQRRAYNQAFANAGVDRAWSVETYRALIRSAGGMKRLAALQADGKPALTAAQVRAVHADKIRIACAEIRTNRTPLRPGVADLVAFAKARGIALAIVTGTYRENIDAILDAADGQISASDFATILTVADAAHAKPAPDVYRVALNRLSIAAHEAIAVEDTETSVASAKAARIFTIATPGAFAADQDFNAADVVTTDLMSAVKRAMEPKQADALSVA